MTTNVQVCDRCRMAVMTDEWEWLDGERICAWCQNDPDGVEPDPTAHLALGPPHVYSRFWEGER
jgi:hypothetical protein